MRRLLLFVISFMVIVSASGCKKSELPDVNTTVSDVSSENTSVEITAPAAATDLSVEEIADLYNNAIIGAVKVTKLYSHARYENFELSADSFESAAKSVLDNVIKDNNTEYTTTEKSEIEELLPKPCLDKAKIKKYENSDGKIKLYLYDEENPADESCVKFYPTNFISNLLSKYNISVADMKMTYTDCKIEFSVDDNKNVTDLSYSWKVNARGNFELLFKTQSFGADICVEESFKF